MDNEMERRAMVKTAYSAHRSLSINFIVRKFKFSSEEAEDIYQNVWVWIMKRGKAVPDLRKVENISWLRRYLVQYCINHIRGKGRHQELIKNWLIKITDINYTGKKAKDVEDAMDLAVAYDVLDSIKEDWGGGCREIFDLYFRDGYSVKEMTKFTSFAEQTIKNKLVACRAKLKEVLTALWK